MRSRNLITPLLILIFSSSLTTAEHGTPRNYIFWPINMEFAHEARCLSFINAIQTIECQQEINGALQVNFVRTEGMFGVVYFVYEDEIDFIEVSDGHIFFYERLSGGMEDSRASTRKIFCISTQSGNRGYAWNGNRYEYHQEATETCPIGQEEWPWER